MKPAAAPPPRSSRSPLAPGVELDAEVLGFAEGLDCLARAGSQRLYVQRAVPGDRVRVRVTQVRERAVRGEVVGVLTPSPDRVTPRCPFADWCAGCDFPWLAPRAQAAWKRDAVVRSLVAAGLTDPAGLVRPTQTPADPWHQRLKVGFRVTGPAAALQLGMFAEHTRTVVPVTSCVAQDGPGTELAFAAARLLGQAGWEGFDEQTGAGRLRALVVRVAPGTEQRHLTVVSTGDDRDDLAAVAPALLAAGARGVSWSRHDGTGPALLGTPPVCLAGRPTLEARVDRFAYRLSPGSFFQTSRFGAQALLRIVEAALMGLPRRGVALDLYCGVGFFSLLLATRLARVIGIEASATAVEDARASAERAAATQATFLACGVAEALGELATDGGFDGQPIALAVVDPARSGCEPGVLERLTATVRPLRIVYVSCDLAALRRDLARLLAGGYRVREATPVDMFPHTEHVETVVLLEPA